MSRFERQFRVLRMRMFTGCRTRQQQKKGMGSFEAMIGDAQRWWENELRSRFGRFFDVRVCETAIGRFQLLEGVRNGVLQ
ncbi:hypothetical protein [Nitrosococcus wardiae]|uniref:Uncharacterized protein n=1 Tax=Nitrosococcus wardiae TaxID=1814290 RepID=A0A4P7BWT3_9GAMM|nr:hypothetical protein [Nitrosococcus wardiae]QBQ54421.1 hypothetical protein E3U44_07795 [Nitrosococcus wardiae]